MKKLILVFLEIVVGVIVVATIIQLVFFGKTDTKKQKNVNTGTSSDVASANYNYNDGQVTQAGNSVVDEEARQMLGKNLMQENDVNNKNKGELYTVLLDYKLALEIGDYSYAYNRLDGNFKLSNFPSIEGFKEYISGKYINIDKLDFYIESYTHNGSKYVCKVEIEDNSNVSYMYDEENYDPNVVYEPYEIPTTYQTFYITFDSVNDYKVSFDK